MAACSYCTSVHAKRFVELTKEPEVIDRLCAEGVQAPLAPRRKAIVEFSAKLARDPASMNASDLVPLRAQGLTDAEILDLVQAVAMFSWANRLMQSLGEPVAG